MAAFEVLSLDPAVPQIRAPGAADTYTFPRAVELPLGTANGVLYLNGSKVVSSGSALTFDGSTLQTISAIRVPNAAAETNALLVTTSATSATIETRYGTPLIFGINASEQMRLTSTGLGIGTNNPTSKLTLYTGSQNLNDGANALRLEYNGGSLPGNIGAGIVFAQKYFTSQADIIRVGAIYGIKNAGDGAFGGGLAFYTQPNSASNLAQVMQLDMAGNLGLGVTPSAWAAGGNLQLGSAKGIAFGGNAYIYANAFSGGGGNTYIASAAAAQYAMETGAHKWFTAPSGTAGNAISFTQALTLTAASNLKLGGTADRATTAGTNHLDIFNGTAPVGTLANGISLYSDAGEAYVMDAAGNATLISPHDAKTNEWIFRSKHTPTGKVLKIDVERLLRFVNDHFGLDAVKEFVEA